MPLTRSQQMARIRSADTLPERILRSSLWRAGLRYRLHSKQLPGRPDLVFVGQRTAVFIDGCFWHGCPEHYVPPRSGTAYWTEKIAGNVARDIRRTRELEAVGWRVIRVWECQVEQAPEATARMIGEAVRAETWKPPLSWRVSQVEPIDAGVRERRHLEELRGASPVRIEERFRSFILEAEARKKQKARLPAP